MADATEKDKADAAAKVQADAAAAAKVKADAEAKAKADSDAAAKAATASPPAHPHHIKPGDGPKGGRFIVRGVAVDAFGNEHPEKARPDELKENPPAPVVPPAGPTPGAVR